MLAGAVHHRQTDFLYRRIHIRRCAAAFRHRTWRFHHLAVAVQTNNSAGIQTVCLTFVQDNGLHGTGFANAIHNRDDAGFHIRLLGFVRHYVEIAQIFRHFNQIVAGADFGYGIFHHHRLRGADSHLFAAGINVGSGVIFVRVQFFLRFGRAVRQCGVRRCQCGHLAGEFHQFAQVLAGNRVFQIAVHAEDQIAAVF